MPLPIAHGFLGAATVAAIYPNVKKKFAVPLFVGGFLAIAADFDFLFVVLTSDKSWHRGFSHSVLFSIIVFSAITLILGKSRIRESFAFGSAYFSHIILDYLTTKSGGGLELLWFFSSEKFKFDYFGLTELPSRLSIAELLAAIGLEFLIFGTIFFSVFFTRRFLINKQK